MTEAEFISYARDRLLEADQRDALDWARAGAKEGGRLLAAQVAFPDMELGEMWALDRERRKSGKRGRPGNDKATIKERAMEPIWLAARDVDRIRALWADVNPAAQMSAELALQIAADRRNVKLQTLVDQVRRPASRRIDRLAAEK